MRIKLLATTKRVSVHFGRLSNREGKQKPFRKSQFCLYALGKDICYPKASEVKYLLFFSAKLSVILHSLVPSCYFLQLPSTHQKSYC